MRQILTRFSWEKKAAVFFLALVLLIALGPFGTYSELTLSERFVYWTVLMIGIGFFMHVAITVSLATPYLGHTPQAARLVLGAMIAAVPSLAIVVFVHDVYRAGATADFNFILKWGQITLLGIAIGTLEYVNWRAPATPPPVEVTSAFHKRLPPELGRDIISMSMQDHYVEVTTTSGKDMLLIRFSDALQEITPVAGQRIHRSHWVAARHVIGLEKDGQRHLANLSDGRRLPVSATYADAARAMLTTAARG